MAGPSDAPDPRIRGRIPTLTEVVERPQGEGAFVAAAERRPPPPSPVPDLGEIDAEIDAGMAPQGTAPDDAVWVELLLQRLAPQIEQIVRDAMREAQFAALAQVREALRPQIEGCVRAASATRAPAAKVIPPSGLPSGPAGRR